MCRCRYTQSTARCDELERRHKDKVDIVRKSYRTQLNNAIQKIAGEYQVMVIAMYSTCSSVCLIVIRLIMMNCFKEKLDEPMLRSENLDKSELV